MKQEVSIDFFGRLDLSWRKQDHSRYLAEEKKDGTIILTPLASARIPLVPLPEEDNEPVRQ